MPLNKSWRLWWTVALLLAVVFVVQPVDTVQAASAAEIASLISLYDALGGDAWTNGSAGSGAWQWKTAGNLPNGDPCTNNWYGVVCDGSGNIQHLILTGNNLTGNIDAVGLDLSGLVNLEGLDLSVNQIGGSIEGFDLSNNTALTHLYLNTNPIGGNIEGFDLTNNAALLQLQLAATQIGGNIDGFDLTNNTALTHLHLGVTQIGGNIDGFDLTNNTALTDLFLFGNQIGGSIDGFDLSNNTALHHLDLAWNQISGPLPSWLDGGILSLWTLNISYNLCLQPSGIAAVDSFVTTEDPDWQTTNTNAACQGTLQVNAVCNGTALSINIADGNPLFNISASDPGGTPFNVNGISIGTITLGSTGPGTWTNITVTELSGDTETLNLPDVTCTQPPPPQPDGCEGCGGGETVIIEVPVGGEELLIDVISPTEATNREGSHNPFVLDDRLVWLVEVTNPGDDAATNVVARVQIDAVADITDVETTHGTVTWDAENVVTANIGTLQGHETATITVETLVIPVAEGCTSGWLDWHVGDDTECVGIYLVPGMLPLTGTGPTRVASLLVETLAGAVIVGAAVGWVLIRRRCDARQ